MDKPLSPKEFLKERYPALSEQAVTGLIHLYEASHKALEDIARSGDPVPTLRAFVMLLDYYGERSSYVGAISQALLAGIALSDSESKCER